MIVQFPLLPKAAPPVSIAVHGLATLSLDYPSQEGEDETKRLDGFEDCHAESWEADKYLELEWVDRGSRVLLRIELETGEFDYAHAVVQLPGKAPSNVRLYPVSRHDFEEDWETFVIQYGQPDAYHFQALLRSETGMRFSMNYDLDQDTFHGSLEVPVVYESLAA